VAVVDWAVGRLNRTVGAVEGALRCSTVLGSGKEAAAAAAAAADAHAPADGMQSPRQELARVGALKDSGGGASAVEQAPTATIVSGVTGPPAVPGASLPPAATAQMPQRTRGLEGASSLPLSVEDSCAGGSSLQSLDALPAAGPAPTEPTAVDPAAVGAADAAAAAAAAAAAPWRPELSAFECDIDNPNLAEAASWEAAGLAGCDVCVMSEAVEQMAGQREASESLMRAVIRGLKPRVLLVTTPNR
jgi:hypothetical protein